MYTAVLTGDVGAGKSTMLAVWREMGANVISADDVAKAQWRRDEVRRAAETRWGVGLYDERGEPIFAAIAERAFASREDTDFANALIHPRTVAEIDRLRAAPAPWAAVEIPLVFETGVPDWADCVVYAAAPMELRASRNVSRGWDEREIARREDKMMPRERKMAMADVVVENTGDIKRWQAVARELGERFARS